MPPPDTQGYFDLQVNGYGGVDFNQDDLTADQLHRACEKLASDGVDAIFATVITERVPTMCHRLARLVQLRNKDALVQRLIAGFHVEGPFINPEPGYVGAHPRDAVVPADEDAATQLLEAGAGLVKLFTLAPEKDAGMKVTRLLARQGVAVSAGHTNASLEDLRAAIDAGLMLFTHLGNGCPMRGMDRNDNIIQRALSLSAAGRLTPAFIADGVHVPFFALANYLRCAGLDRCIIVTDAISPAGLGPGRYTVGRWDLLIGDDMVARASDGSHLIGAVVTMRQSEANLMRHLDLTAQQCRQLTVQNPRRALNILDSPANYERAGQVTA